MSNEIKQEVRTHITRLYCNCGEEMISGMTVLTTYPANYSYYCKRCDYTEICVVLYPKVTYEVIND